MLGISECGYVEEIWRCCVREVNNVMSFAVGAMYVRQQFDNESTSLALSMIWTVEEAFLHNLYNLDWIDFNTKIAAEYKADAMTDKIGS